MLKVLAGAQLSSILSPQSGPAVPRPSAARPDLIRAENEKPGTTDWLLSNSRVDETGNRCPWIEGYCSRNRVRAGDTLEIMVSTNPPSPFVIDLFRLGYYGGKGGRHLDRLGPFQGKVQPDPGVGEERLRECAWEPATKIVIPSTWPSGVYLGKLTADRDNLQSYVIFIVRDDRACDFLFQCSDTTWQAYNRWPSKWSLYDDGKKEGYWGPGVRVSWDRPYYMGNYMVIRAPLSLGSGEFLMWEFPLAFWMEKEGYDVSYISDVDTHEDPQGLLRTKGWLSVGHDEYWSPDMFSNVKAAIAAGLNAAFFSGNTCDGVLVFYPGSHGVTNRVISRVGQWGPVDPRNFDHGFPEMANFKQNYPTEASLIGARTTFPWWGVGDWTCTDEQHWIFERTGMKNGDAIPSLVGWEWHGDPADIPGLRVVAKAQTKGSLGAGTATATIYHGPKGNIVFNASSCWWGDGLSAPPGYLRPLTQAPTLKGPDPRVQRITANVLARMRHTP